MTIIREECIYFWNILSLYKYVLRGDSGMVLLWFSCFFQVYVRVALSLFNKFS